MKIKRSISLVLWVALLCLSAAMLSSCPKTSLRRAETVQPAQPKVIPKLQVVMSIPAGKITDQSELDTITVSFNQPMAPLSTVPRDESTGPLAFQPPLTGKYRWLGTATLAFTPREPLPPGATIKAIVPAGTKAISGAALESEYSWTFETLRPILKDTIPDNERHWVSLKSNLYLRFNQPLDTAIAEKSITLAGAPSEAKNAKKGKFIAQISVRGLTTEDAYAGKKWKEYDKDTILVIDPKEPMKPGCSYTLTVASGLKGKGGELGTEKKFDLNFHTQNIFEIYRDKFPRKQKPEENLELYFSNPVYVKELAKNISIHYKKGGETRELKLPDYYDEYDYDSATPSLYLHFDAQTEYEVRISGNLKDIFENILGSDAAFSFKTLDFEPDLAMAEGNGVVESRSRHQIPVSVLNINKVRLKMGKVKKDRVIPLLNSPSFESGDPVNPGSEFFDVDKVWSLDAPRNSRKYLPIELDDTLKGASTGIVFVQLDTIEKYNYVSQYQKALVQVSNLGVTAKFSPENNLVWVTTLDKAEPVNGADVEIRDDENKVLWKGRTDKDGLVWTKGWAALGFSKKEKWDRPPNLWVFASHGDDFAFINSEWNWGISSWAFDVPYDWSPEERECTAALFTEKGLYKRGEEVRIKGIFREKKRGEWKISSIKSASLRVYNSRNEQVFKGNVSLSEYGSLDKIIKIADDAPTGDYRIELWYSLPKRKAPEEAVTEHFRVEDFKAADFKVTVDSKKKEYIFQDTFEGEVKGEYLFGAPMSGDKTSWRFRISPFEFRPKGYDDFLFGPAYDEEARETTSLLGTGEGKLDDNGKVKVRVPLKVKDVRQTMMLTVESSVVATDRSELSGYGDFVVHKGEYYIGVKPDSTFVSAKKPQSIQIVAVTPGGEKKSGESIKVEVYERIWHSVRKAGMYGREWVTEKKDTLVKSYDVRSAKEVSSIEFTPEKSGYYVVKASGTDGRQNSILTEVGFYASGTDYVPWARTEDNIVELIKDKNEYKPGDKARIIIKSPYENAKALVTWEREFVIDRKIVDVKGSADVIVCPIEKSDLPNVFISVVLIQGRVAEDKFSEYGEDLGKPSFRIGYVNLPVVSEDKKLKVTVTPDKERYGPRDEVKVKLRLQDNVGKPVVGEICLAAVDEGVLSLIDFKTPDCYPAFYGPRSLAVRNSESRLHVIGQRDYGEKGESSGGGGGLDLSAIALRTEFKSTPYWNPGIITNKGGEAEISFRLPDNLTTFRLMAVAATKQSSFGSGEKSFIVTKPLLLKEAHPRFVRLGDSFQGGITVFNGTGKRDRVTVQLQCKGLTLSGESSKEVIIDDGQEKEVLFSFKADKPSIGELGFRAAMGPESDGLKCTIPVRVPLFTETTATSGTIEGKRADEKLTIPGGVVPTVGGLYIDISSTAMVGLKGGVDYLYNYSYECLEQKLSRVMPGLMAQDLVETFDLSANLRGKAYRDYIQGFLNTLKNYQQSSGGFGIWKDSLIPNDYVSCYVLFTMAKAREAGYEVDMKVAQKGLEYLKDMLKRSDDDWGDSYHYYFNRNCIMTIKSFALYDLYLWKKGEPSYISLLYQKSDEMSLFGQALLLKSLHMYGRDPEHEKLLTQSFMNKIKKNPTTAHFEERDESDLSFIFNSNVRTTAIILQALLETGANFPDAPRVVKWLTQAQKMGRWGTTQENVFAFWALTTYFKKYEKETPDFVSKALIDGKAVMEEKFAGRELTLRKRDITMSDLSPGKESTVKFEKNGKGKMYYTLRLTYAPIEGVEWKDEGIAVMKVIEPVEQVLSQESYQAGTVYKITLSLVTPQERTYVVVDDPLPGGFTVVNTAFATERKELLRKLESVHDKEMKGRWGETFNHFETYDDRVLLFADVLSAGEHSFSYFVRAQYFGSYHLPPTKAEMMYEPEVFGYSRKRSVEIK